MAVQELSQLNVTWRAIHPNIGLHFFPRPTLEIPYSMLYCDGPTDHENDLWVVEQYNNHVAAGALMAANELLIYYVEEISTHAYVCFVSRNDFMLIRGANPLIVDHAAIRCWHQLVGDDDSVRIIFEI